MNLHIWEKKTARKKRKHTVYRQANERTKWKDKEKRKKIYQKYSQCNFSYSATIFIYIFHIHKKKSLSLKIFFLFFSYLRLSVCAHLYFRCDFCMIPLMIHIFLFFILLMMTMIFFICFKCFDDEFLHRKMRWKKVYVNWHIECGCIQTRVLTSNTHVREIYTYISSSSSKHASYSVAINTESKSIVKK